MSTNFPIARARQPAQIVRLQIVLDWRAANDRDHIQPAEADTQAITYRAALADELGRPVRADEESGDLTPYLTAEEQTALLAVLEAVRTRAQRLVES